MLAAGEEKISCEVAKSFLFVRDLDGALISGVFSLKEAAVGRASVGERSMKAEVRLVADVVLYLYLASLRAAQTGREAGTNVIMERTRQYKKETALGDKWKRDRRSIRTM